MAGTLVTDTLTDGSGNSTSTTTVVRGSAKAWVNFNGTGTVAIRASFNVSSITDNGVGNYTLNFTAALADTNYSSAGHTTATLTGMNCITETTKTTSSFQIQCAGISSGSVVATDPVTVNVAIFR